MPKTNSGNHLDFEQQTQNSCMHFGIADEWPIRNCCYNKNRSVTSVVQLCFIIHIDFSINAVWLGNWCCSLEFEYYRMQNA